jgi:GNAT superfamily N-acetyltransferase
MLLMTNVEIKRISSEETYPLRHDVLRPGQPPENLRYPGDDDLETLHVGAFVDDRLVGIASVYHEPPAGYTNPGAWRLRGMVTLPEVRGQKYGIQLLQQCIAYVTEQEGGILWCNSRLNATGFYEAMGFEIIGNPFQLQGHGLRYFMERKITADGQV